MIGASLLLIGTSWSALTPVTVPAELDHVASAFWARDIGAAHAQFDRYLVHRKFATDHAPGGPEHFWRELLAFVDCESLKPDELKPHAPANDWELLVGLVRLERMRQRRGVKDELATPHQQLFTPQFFRRDPSPTAPDDAIVWPAGSELWGDEMLPASAPSAQCIKLKGPSGKALEKVLKEELAFVQALKQKVAPEHPAWASLHVHEAALHFQLGAPEKAIEAARPLFDELPNSLTTGERLQARLLHAMALERAGDREGALAIYRDLADSPLRGRTEAFIQSRREWALASMERYDELLNVLPEEPDLESEVGRYEAYLKARALLALQRFDGLLNHARKTLRRASDAAATSIEIGYLNDEVYEFLATTPFEDRVMEIVESLGPPRFLYQRLERLAQVAAMGLHADCAKAVLRWLLDRHKSAPHQARYRARLAELAFDTGDLKGFATLLRDMATPDETLLRIIPRDRRGQFFEERDRQLLNVVAHAVPRLAERSDDEWTTPVVNTVQRFLQDAPETRVAAELTTLYRTARSLLGTGAKRYAERIGDRRPEVVLGEVELPRVQQALAPPEVPPFIEEPEVLLRIPVGAAASPVRAWFTEVGP